MKSVTTIAAAVLLTTATMRAAEPVQAIPSFESIGLYYDGAAAPDGCRSHYRARGASDWREGYPLVYDPRARQYRGSLVGLQSDTVYDIRLEAGSDRAEIQARTRSDRFPIGKTTYLQSTTDQTVTVKDAGTETGWHLVTPAAGAKFTSDVLNQSDYNIVIAADYVILRGLELKNAAIDGIFIRSGVRLPGFNDDYAGAAPDIGAFENGRPPLQFGREMAPDFARAPLGDLSMKILRRATPSRGWSNSIQPVARASSPPCRHSAGIRAHTHGPTS